MVKAERLPEVSEPIGVERVDERVEIPAVTQHAMALVLAITLIAARCVLMERHRLAVLVVAATNKAGAIEDRLTT